jgi:hypothetical protein
VDSAVPECTSIHQRRIIMTLELLHALVRSRHERLLREARYRRALRRTSRTLPSPRTTLSRVLRATGYAVLSLGDALAESR